MQYSINLEFDVKNTIEQLLSACEDCYPSDGLKAKLDENRPLVIKLGVDPTRPDIHIGHSIVLNQLRQFQDLGHKVVFLIGDFTAMIGDPSGRDVTRPALDEQTVIENAKSYVDQVSKILNREKLAIRYNSEWLSKLSPQAMIKLASLHTVARMLERDDFSKRFKSNQSIAIHEFLYPLLQGYDSVALEADIELGGTDQTFNLLMGRELQRHYGQKQQVVLTYPLLEGLDGVKKMSKSHGNTIGLNDSPEDMFGKMMSISDELMWRYMGLLNLGMPKSVDDYKHDVESGENPKNIKMALAKALVATYYDDAQAEQAEAGFISRFQKGMIPEDRPVHELSKEASKLPLAQLMKLAGLTQSTSESLRMLKQNAVKISGEVVTSNEPIQNFPAVITVGKKRVAEFVLKS